MGVMLDHRIDNPRFVAIESVSPNSHVHVFLVGRTEDLGSEAVGWLREANTLAARRHR